MAENREVSYIENDHIEEGSSLVKERDALFEYIDKLSNLNELDKYWARNDAEKKLLEGVAVGDLEKKYEFYDSAGEIRNSICQRAPDGKGNTICNLIDTSILNVSSEGRGREWKIKELKEIEAAIKSFDKEHDLTKFIQRKNEVKDSVTAKILMLFDLEFADKFTKFQAEMGAPKFWVLSREMSPALFPNFATVFNFRAPRDFLKKLSHKNLPSWPEKIKNALVDDAKEILASPIFDSSRDSSLSAVKNAKTVADVISKLLQLKALRDGGEKKMTEAEAIKKREENKAEDKRIKEEKRRKELEEEKKLSDEKKEAARKKREEREKAEEEKEKRQENEGEGLSAEKKLILDFYNKSIEHAEKVIEECGNWGVRADDIDFWGQEGIKNRVKLLKDRGVWNDYVRFNSNDKNIPSNARGDGFRFRWLNANTGSRISGAGADAGIKYMQRYKESGYMLCVLAGGFSIDYSGSDSPVCTPVEFLEKMQSLKANVLGGK